MSTKAIPVVTVPGVGAAGDAGTGAAGATAAGAERASQSSEQFSKAIETLRGRSDLAAKALGGVGTAAITALGYAKLTDIFPYGGPGWALALLAVGPIAMVVALWFLAHGFNAATQSLITSSDVDETASRNGGMKDAEKELVKRTYQDTAKLNGVKTLRAYEARGQRFERIAERAPAARATVLGEAATRIAAEVAATQERAAAFVLRRRSNRALFAKRTLAYLLLFVAGWYGTALAADALQSERSDSITVAKECAAARALPNIVESKLPGICGAPPAAKTPEAKTPTELSKEAIVALAGAVAECRKATATAAPPAAECAPLERALTVATGSP
jgi:hypothetical protein